MSVIAPYNGIVGFTTVHEVRSIAADNYTIRPYGPGARHGRQLQIGVLASWETLNDLPAKVHPDRYPKIEDIRALLDAATMPYLKEVGYDWKISDGGTAVNVDIKCLRLVHYSGNQPGLCDQLKWISEITGPSLDGFQINMIWPDREELVAWHSLSPWMRLVLQINQAMFEDVARDPVKLLDRLELYGGLATDLLFDMSDGRGKPIDLAEAETVIDALYGAFHGAAAGGVGIGLAGGLRYQNVYDLKRFLERWPDLSFDAESRIRDEYKENGEPRSFLNENAREFARRAAALTT